ncbi:MAG: MerR family transcriptional regulator [Alphaproteobacteria bacterium]|nr:MerR family transcriptional regulator [Alphaproteobacteria bacterium]
MAEIYSIGEFAKLTNVTVKTLRHYEKLGLVMPTYNPDNGYRRYKNVHVAQVESIMALKLLGFGLNEIGAFFNDRKQIATLDLATQKSALLKKMHEIKQVIELIEGIEARKQASELNDWVALIKEMKMEKRNINWYLSASEDDMQKLGTYIPDVKEKDMLKLKWKDLIARAYAQLENFDAALFDELADEWIETVGQFIDNKQTMVAIFGSYAQMHDWPEDRKYFSDQLGEFMAPKLIAKLG